MKINFTREKKTAQIKVAHGLNTQTNSYIFGYLCEDEEYAELLSRHFATNFKMAIRDMRRKAYEQGISDGRGHMEKLKGFSPFMSGEVGWR